MDQEAGVGGSKEKLVALKLSNKLALISGGRAWIGSAIAESFACEGACVSVNGHTKASLETAPARPREAFITSQCEAAGNLRTAEAASDVAH